MRGSRKLLAKKFRVHEIPSMLHELRTHATAGWRIRLVRSRKADNKRIGLEQASWLSADSALWGVVCDDALPMLSG